MIPKNKQVKEFLKEKGFYLVLAVCIVGASAAAWLTANKTLQSIEENNRKVVEQNVSGEEKPWQNSGSIIIPQTPQSQSTANTQPGITKPSASQSAQSAQSSSQPPVSESAAPSEQSATELKPEQSPYALPMDSVGVIQPYSNNELVKNKTLGVWRTHDAVDLKGDKGCDVKAVSDGVILTMGTDPLWGGFIEIKHPDGCVSSYSGVTAEKGLKKGDNVKGGQKLGTLGDIPAEIAMESHLHFAMKKNNAYVDPGLYLELKGLQ